MHLLQPLGFYVQSLLKHLRSLVCMHLHGKAGSTLPESTPTLAVGGCLAPGCLLALPLVPLLLGCSGASCWLMDQCAAAGCAGQDKPLALINHTSRLSSCSATPAGAMQRACIR